MKPGRGIQKLGNGRYRVQIRRDGFATQSAYFTSEKEARQWRDMKIAAVRLDLKSAKESKADVTMLSDLISEYVIEKDLDPKKEKFGQLKWWSDKLGHLRLSKLQPADIAKALRDLERSDKILGGNIIRKADGVKRSPATINRYKAALSSVLSTAEKEWHYIPSNPCKQVKSRTETNERNRWLKEDERNRLLDSCREAPWDGLIVVVQLAICTGARRSELLNLCWSQIEFKENFAEAHLDNTKNRESRTLVIVGEAVEELKAWKAKRDKVTDLVFPAPNNPVKPFNAWRRYWDQALEKADIDNFRFHDLRHTVASYLTQAGIPAITVAAILGHKSLQMTKRYSHLAVEHQREALEKVWSN